MKRASMAGLFALLAAAGFVLAGKESQFGIPVQIVPGVWFVEAQAQTRELPSPCG